MMTPIVLASSIVLMLLPPPSYSLSTERFQSRLFISESMGEAVIQSLLKNFGPNETRLLVRGLSPKHSRLNTTIGLWQSRLKEVSDAENIGIEINPIAFQEYTIEQVPTLSLEVNGKTEVMAAGITSSEWLIRQYQSGKRGHLGSYGTTFPVVETDLLESLKQRLSTMNWNAIMEKAHHKLTHKTFTTHQNLPVSRTESSRTLQSSGSWNTPIIVMDSQDKRQQKAVMEWLTQHPDALIMTSQWSIVGLQKLPEVMQQHLIYLLPSKLVKRFQLNQLPVLLTHESSSLWRMTTAAISENDPLSWYSWLRASLAGITPKAYAETSSRLESQNPSKALCQSVPILSEKLITSVPWNELFPIRIGLAKLSSGKEPNDRAKTNTGLCVCEDSAGMFHPGVTTGFWRPQRLIELTRSPGCLMALGGHKLPIVDQRRWGTLGSANIPKGLTYMHAHVYSLPLIEMLNMYTGIGGCNSDLVDFDLINLSEVDPSWNHPELAALLSPDLAAYANPAAINACTADGLAALNAQPMDSLHWCAGSWGSLYPLSGFTSTYGHFSDNTSLLATRALAKIHRIGLGRKTVGNDAQCHSRITPWLPKSQYKMSMFWPDPEKHKAHWIGASAATWGMHRHPLAKDDAMYLVWQYRDCCQTAVSQ